MVDKKRDLTNTQVNINKADWAKFKAICTIKGDDKNSGFSEAIKDYNEKNKGVFK
jgi:hypothetical protein